MSLSDGSLTTTEPMAVIANPNLSGIESTVLEFLGSQTPHTMKMSINVERNSRLTAWNSVSEGCGEVVHNPRAVPFDGSKISGGINTFNRPNPMKAPNIWATKYITIVWCTKEKKERKTIIITNFNGKQTINSLPES